ncbi:MAG: response regulator transcription factor [Nitrospirae bacterium]|nr:response regulator transcription factor [Nitrospirota bacterium]
MSKNTQVFPQSAEKQGVQVCEHKPETFLQSTLNALIESVGTLLHPSALEDVVRRFGIQVGRQALERYQLVTRRRPPYSKKDYAQCLEGLNELWGWRCDMVEETGNSLTIHIPVCPFGARAKHALQLCALTSGVLGGIAAEQFGYAKVCMGQDGGAARLCLVKVYIRRTEESDATAGTVYPQGNESLNGHLTTREFSTVPPDRLSRREWEVLKQIGEGLSDKDVAASLNLSVRTAANHAARIRDKLGLSNRAGLIRFALRHHLSDL